MTIRPAPRESPAEDEFAILVSDAYQGNGFGGELLRRLVQIGRDEKLKRIVATILADNVAMQRVSRNTGFKLQRVESEFHAELDLFESRGRRGGFALFSARPAAACNNRLKRQYSCGSSGQRERPFCLGRRTRQLGSNSAHLDPIRAYCLILQAPEPGKAGQRRPAVCTPPHRCPSVEL